MPHVYRAYRHGVGFSSHDSQMPAQTWAKVRGRKDSYGMDVAELRKRGWVVRHVELGHATPSSTSREKPVEQAPQPPAPNWVHSDSPMSDGMAIGIGVAVVIGMAISAYLLV